MLASRDWKKPIILHTHEYVDLEPALFKECFTKPKQHKKGKSAITAEPIKRTESVHCPTEELGRNMGA